jgi:hypothetical protein
MVTVLVTLLVDWPSTVNVTLIEPDWLSAGLSATFT